MPQLLATTTPTTTTTTSVNSGVGTCVMKYKKKKENYLLRSNPRFGSCRNIAGAGGIFDGRGVAAVLALGAEAVRH
jgi:dihydroorotate dehydrogenase